MSERQTLRNTGFEDSESNLVDAYLKLSEADPGNDLLKMVTIADRTLLCFNRSFDRAYQGAGIRQRYIAYTRDLEDAARSSP